MVLVAPIEWVEKFDGSVPVPPILSAAPLLTVSVPPAAVRFARNPTKLKLPWVTVRLPAMGVLTPSVKVLPPVLLTVRLLKVGERLTTDALRTGAVEVKQAGAAIKRSSGSIVSGEIAGDVDRAGAGIERTRNNVVPRWAKRKIASHIHRAVVAIEGATPNVDIGWV